MLLKILGKVGEKEGKKEEKQGEQQEKKNHFEIDQIYMKNI